jgi:hypothetical protein
MHGSDKFVIYLFFVHFLNHVVVGRYCRENYFDEIVRLLKWFQHTAEKGLTECVIVDATAMAEDEDDG